jgi:hypothetical protein
MSSSTPPAYSSPRVSLLRPAAIGWLLLVSACGPSAEVTIALESAPSADLSTMTALRITVRDLTKEEPEIFGPFEIDRADPERLATTIEPGNDFYIDVWGCESTARCAPTEVVARGCTAILNVAPGTTDTVVTVTLDESENVPATRCPPESP